MFQKSALLKCIQNSRSSADLTLFNKTPCIIFDNSRELRNSKMERPPKKKHKASLLSKLKRCKSTAVNSKTKLRREKHVNNSNMNNNNNNNNTTCLDLSFDLFKTTAGASSTASSAGLLSSTLANSTIEMNRRSTTTTSSHHRYQHQQFMMTTRTIYQDESLSSSDDSEDDSSLSFYSIDVTVDDMESSLSSVSSLEFEPFESILSTTTSSRTIRRKSLIKAPLISSSRSTLASTSTTMSRSSMRLPAAPPAVSSSRKSLFLNSLNVQSPIIQTSSHNRRGRRQQCDLSLSSYCSYCCEVASSSPSINICSSTLISNSYKPTQQPPLPLPSSSTTNTTDVDLIKNLGSNFYSSVISAI